MLPKKFHVELPPRCYHLHSGYPSHQELSAACGSDGVVEMTKGQRHYMNGNAMHLPTAALMQAVALACVKPVEPWI